MKILMILSNPIITDERPYKEAKTLIEAGNSVTVIIWDRRHEYKSEDVFEGIKLVRIHNKSLMRVLPNDFIRHPLWWRTAYKKGLELRKNGFKFDVVHCHDLDTLYAGVKLKKKTGCKLVYDAHEIFGLTDMPKIACKAAFLMEKILIKNTDHVIAAYNPIKGYIDSITKNPSTIILNCKDIILDEYKSSNNKIFTICYIGGLVKSRMFPDLVDIIGDIDNVKFVVAGMKSGLYKEVKERCKKYKNCEFLGQIPAKEVISKTLESNAVICMFDPKEKAHQIGLPNKLFEAMVTGRPIIVTKNVYYSIEFVNAEKMGLSISNEKEEVKNAIITLRDNPELCETFGKNGIKAAKEKYNWETQKKKLLKIYEDMT